MPFYLLSNFKCVMCHEGENINKNIHLLFSWWRSDRNA